MSRISSSAYKFKMDPKESLTCAEVDSAPTASAQRLLKHKRRYCRVDGCTKIVKSQGLCQRHGAKPRKCKVEGCVKQAQGNFDGMCKSHFKAHKKETTASHQYAIMNNDEPLEPTGSSVYDKLFPACMSWSAVDGTKLPLIQHLREGFEANKPPAWHRNEERLARGLYPVTNPATQLEGWERELVWMEICILTGSPDAFFRHLARGWGRDKGFHVVLAQFICERNGDMERKKRERIIRKKPEVEQFSHVWQENGVYDDDEINEALAEELINNFYPGNGDESDYSFDDNDLSNDAAISSSDEGQV